MESPVLRRYEIEELLSLRDSPLVQKPASLPPIEEWMGTPPTVRPQTTRSRADGDSLLANHEDGAKIGMTSTRRPSLFETRHLSRPSLADDIILGPPKMMFASSSTRTPCGKFDHDSQATSLGSPAIDEERESPRFERFRMGGNTRLGKEMDKDRPERNSLRGDHTKRGFGRDDTEGWTGASRQPRKSFGAEDGDRFRGTGDRGKRETPWDKDRPPKYDNFGREREHRPRGRRDEASWLLEDRGTDRGDRDHYRDRDHHRYNSSNNRNEKDPEWMDSGPGNEDKTGDSKAVHSMEEFQRWKEKMKASNAPEEKKIRAEAPAELVGQDKFPKEPKGSHQSTKETGNSHSAIEEPATAPAVVENGVDRFFGLWGAPSSSKSPEQDILGNMRPETKTAVKSRFTSFFTPQEPVSPNIPEPPIAAKIPTPVNESSSEDKEGFQRILDLLTSNSLGSSEPVSVPSPGISRPPQPSVSPLASMMPPHPPPSHSQQTPITSPPHHRDPNADFFMRLMQQNQSQGPPPPPPLHAPYGGPSQMPPPPPISTSPHSFQRAKNNPLSPAFDDPAITAFRQRSSQESTSPILPRGPPLMEQHGPPGSWNHQQQQQQLSQQQQPQPQPQQPPPPQNHRQVAPPPGFARPQQQQHHHQGPPPPPAFLGPLPGVNGPQSMPFALGPPPNLPPNFGPHTPPFFGMNGMNGHPPPPPPPPPQMNGPPPQGYHIPLHHPHAEPHGPLMGMHGPPFGFPHDGPKHPQHSHGPGNPRFPNESLHRQLR
ncbi:unnamed protein product [Tuber aestivum]|uniref:Uncharacterized protein n=1 Tax=Tuber aestivum TaxID=59557 RepID=A0A292Q7H4_9PEZI|nr:unnamed protein product [Tuber aestivum]